MSSRNKHLPIFVILVAASALMSLPACSMLVNSLGGASSRMPQDLKRDISPGAKALIDAAYRDIDPERLFDFHTHLVGLGEGETGACVNPRMLRWWNVSDYMKFRVYLSGAGVKDVEGADQAYVERLASLVREMPVHGRHLLLAFDEHHDDAGLPSPEHTEFHTPNAYVHAVATAQPELFGAALSVHPLRADAIEVLEQWASKGMRVVKWLPNAMNICPCDPRLDKFYARMAELDMVLLTHAGEEKAVHADEAQALGNPLMLRGPLDAGVKVIVAHCASLGKNVDYETDGAPLRSNYELFTRLMDDGDYEGLVFGEISAMTQFNRMGDPLLGLLDSSKYHGRLVNGSDYPLPAINIVIRTSSLRKAGYITEYQEERLNEIYDFNPLLFDFVLKRTLTHPKTKVGFPASVFMPPPAVAPWPLGYDATQAEPRVFTKKSPAKPRTCPCAKDIEVKKRDPGHRPCVGG